MKNIAKYLDSTILRCNAQSSEIVKLCLDAEKNGFASVCVNPYFIPLCKQTLSPNSKVKICTVIGFPLGQTTIQTKCFETKNALELGAQEIDVVLNISALIANDLDYVIHELVEIKKICGSKILKVIIETCLLTDKQKIDACHAVDLSGADFIKTSSGFSTGGATVEDVVLLRKHVDKKIGVKASGGINTFQQACQLIEAGANRIGTSKAIKIMEE